MIGSLLVAASLILASGTAPPPPLNVGSDGSDGAFVFVPDTPGGSTMTIDLALAASGLDGGGMPITWQTPSPVPGRGVYDPAIWAVVFKYAAVTVPPGATIQFANHPARAPVIWLVQTTCTVHGSILLRGRSNYPNRGEPGPGGFRGGWNSSGGGHGMGAPTGPIGAAVHACPAAGCYGGPACFPLVGGSGSGGYCSLGGGGAILVAANERITLASSSSVDATGGGCFAGWNGAGGAIRLVSDRIDKSDASYLYASGGYIRLEANTYNGSLAGSPTPTLGSPGRILPDATTATLRVVSITVGGQTYPVVGDPMADVRPLNADVITGYSGNATITLEARNVMPGRTCTLRVLNTVSTAGVYTSTGLVGTQGLSTATVNVYLSPAVYALQARVEL